MRPRLVALVCASLYTGAAMCAATEVRAEDNRIAQLRTMSLADVLQVDISTGTSKLIHQAPGVAYVITAPDIARMGARNMQEVLESIPGFNVYLYQGLVNSPIVDMRGLSSERGGYILFLRDGRPLRLLSNNTMPEVFRLPVHFIERIEVARGPASAVYGADALAAAVNIITRNNPDEAGVRIGDDDALAGWAGLSGKTPIFDWAMAASTSRYNIEAVTRRRQPAREFTQDFGQHYSDIDVKLASGPFRVSLWALNYHKEETGNPANPRGFVDVRTRHRHADVEYTANLGATTELKADLFYTYFRGTRQNELVMGQPANGDNGEERTTATLTLTETRFASHRLRANAGFMRERRGNYQPPPPLPPGAPPPPPPQPSSRDVSFASLQDEYAFLPDWELTAGLRVDRYDDLGPIYSPRAGLVWTIDPTLTAKLLQSSGFRAPGPALANTTSTRPEEAKNLELAFDYRPSERWRAVVNAYRYSANNLVVAGGPAAVPVAREGKGGEVEVSWLASQAFKLEASLAAVAARDRRTDARAPYTPRTSAKVSANWRPRDDWTWHVRWEGYWDIERPAADPRPALQDFQLVHATVRHEFNRNISALFAVHNLFDKRTYIPVLSGGNQDDYQLAPRNLSLQVEVRF